MIKSIILLGLAGFLFSGDDTDPAINPGAFEVCDGVDNDCDRLVDEGVGFCSAAVGCAGVFSCASFPAGACPEGCQLNTYYGRCLGADGDGRLCAGDADCVLGGSCEGYGGAVCEGVVSCAGLSVAECSLYPGCSLPGCGSFVFRSTTDPLLVSSSCEGNVGCSFSCVPPLVEICSNRQDDDGDGFVDCADAKCQFVSVAAGDVERYNCLGSSVTGSVSLAAGQYYCSVSETDASVGLCCPAGSLAFFDVVLDRWTCRPTEPCYRADGTRACDYLYASEFLSWRASRDYLGSDWCVAPEEGKACCQVVKYGVFSYYDDEGNVKIY